MEVKTELHRFYTVSNRALDLDELQGEPDFIASRKAKSAAQLIQTGPVIIEDVSLCFNAL